VADQQFGNLTRKAIVDELLRLGILREKKKPKVAKPTGMYGQVATPPSTKQWGFSIRAAMRPNRAFRTSRTAYKPSFRRYI
jgi:hypothetical protein